jgi:tetratricopeptide (TPR) repeat protein
VVVGYSTPPPPPGVVRESDANDANDARNDARNADDAARSIVPAIADAPAGSPDALEARGPADSRSPSSLEGIVAPLIPSEPPPAMEVPPSGEASPAEPAPAEPALAEPAPAEAPARAAREEATAEDAARPEPEGAAAAPRDTVPEGAPASMPERADTLPSEASPEASPDARDTADETSIPPVSEPSDPSDAIVDAASEQFFSEADLSVHRAALEERDDEESWPAAEKAKQKARPEVVQRRARFARYVTWAVGAAAVVCLAAFVRTALAPRASSSLTSSRVAANALAVEAPKESPAPPTTEEPKAAEPQAAEPKAADPGVVAANAANAATAAAAATAATEPSEEPAPVAAPSSEPKAAEPSPATTADPKAAAEAKRESQRALERGKVADAIEAGKRSVALDATDGEAWLILGAAYQQKGDMAEARAAYKACLHEGKRGPRGECAAMLR